MEKSRKLLSDVQPGKEREGGGRKIESGRESDKDKGGEGGKGGEGEGGKRGTLEQIKTVGEMGKNGRG